MSWLEKLLPAKIQQTNPTDRHQPIWRKTRTSVPAAATTTASAPAPA
jgi:acetyl-CoA carboxylase carboxyl transferase subunit beta